MESEPPAAPDDPEPTSAPADEVHIQSVLCGRCGWPNACRVQSGMRALRFMCQWCDQMTTGIVDASLKRHIIF
jgi:transcription elongation factor Elf1